MFFEQIEHFSNYIDFPIEQEKTFFSLTGIIFLTIVFFFLIQFILRITSIFRLKKAGKNIKNDFGKIVLHPKKQAPFSFLEHIYLNINSWKNHAIEKEILLHEKGHVSQKHSFDILFVEIIKIVFWFQPMLYFFKKAIQENHEFLADAYCLEQTENIKEYQTIILNYYNNQNKQLELSSSFNYNNLKKRLMIMKNTKKANVKQVMFYATISTITFFGLIGIETKASSIKNLEIEVSKQVDVLIKSNVIEKNEEPLKKSIVNYDETIKNTDVKTLILEYVKGKKSSGYFSDNNLIYYYIISPELEVSIYDRYGVKQNEKEFKYKLEVVANDEGLEKSKSNFLQTEIDIKTESEKKKEIEREFQNAEMNKKFIKASPKDGMDVFNKEFFQNANFSIPEGEKLFKIVLNFVVEVDGSFSNIKVVNDVDEVNKKEAIRVLKLMSKWNPAKENGKAVASNFYIPISILNN